MKPTPLIIIAALFAFAFIGRGAALASAVLSKPEKTANTKAVMETAVNSEMNAPISPALETSPAPSLPQPILDEPVITTVSNENIDEFIEALRERSNELDAKAIDIENRTRILEILETRAEEKFEMLKTAHDDLSKLVSFANEASENDITLLARMYEQMKPQKAGEIFDKMNPTFAAGFLTEMNSENAALILANMTTDKAYQTSMVIASRNAAIRSQ